MSQLERRRSSIEIIADILRLGQAGKSEIKQAVNMTYRQLDKYLSILSELKLVDTATLSNQSVTYRVTGKGLRLLRNIDSMLEMLWGEEKSR